MPSMSQAVTGRVKPPLIAQNPCRTTVCASGGTHSIYLMHDLPICSTITNEVRLGASLIGREERIASDHSVDDRNGTPDTRR